MIDHGIGATSRRHILIVVGLMCLGTPVLVQGCGRMSSPGSPFVDGPGRRDDPGIPDPCFAFGCLDGDADSTNYGPDRSPCGDSPTALTGKVYDPAGKMPLYNVTIYVPNDPVADIAVGLSTECDRCDVRISGNPIAIGVTDASGSFTLENVPDGVPFKLVMQIGKWRRIVDIPSVPSCKATALEASLTRLPRNHLEGDIPQIALATGGADPLECLFRKIGLEDSEFGVAGDKDKRVHLYAGGDTATATPPQISTKSSSAGSAFPSASTSLWNSVESLKAYDLLVLACEGSENASSKPEASRQALYDYAKLGGRVFTSHSHHYWFSNSPVPEVKGLATWANDHTCPGTSCTCPPSGAPIQDAVTPISATCSNIYERPDEYPIVNATLNEGFPKGAAMKEWLKNTGGLTGPGDTMPLQEYRHNVDQPQTGLISWMAVNNPVAAGRRAYEYVSFDAPVGVPDDQVCGRVVFTDLHAGADDKTNQPFPDGCTHPDLTPQQKALEFMLFDLSSCIQNDQLPVNPPK
jgi:hypothetical protein